MKYIIILLFSLSSLSGSNFMHSISICSKLTIEGRRKDYKLDLLFYPPRQRVIGIILEHDSVAYEVPREELLGIFDIQLESLRVVLGVSLPNADDSYSSVEFKYGDPVILEGGKREIYRMVSFIFFGSSRNLVGLL